MKMSAWARNETMQVYDKAPETRTGLRPQDETMSDVRTTVSKCVGGRTCLSQMQVIGNVAKRLWPLMRADAFAAIWRGGRSDGARGKTEQLHVPQVLGVTAVA